MCHHIPFLAAMLLIFCGKKHWVPFFPTIPVCLVLMTVCVAVIPCFVAAGFTLSVFTIYGVITLNGFCAGLSQSLVSRIVVLFPGGKSSLLIRHGESKWHCTPLLLLHNRKWHTNMETGNHATPQQQQQQTTTTSNEKRSKMLMKMVTFKNAFKSGDFLKKYCFSHGFNVNEKRNALKLTHSDYSW